LEPSIFDGARAFLRLRLGIILGEAILSESASAG